jgi:hypothetical protein
MSRDGGESFEPNRRLSSASGLWSFQGIPSIGDRLGMASSGDAVHVAWTDARHDPVSSEGGNIYGVTLTDLPTSIAVPRFVAEVVGGAVELGWTVRDASGITGFRVHRAEDGRAEVPLADVALAGAGEHRYLDPTVAPGGRYRYRLEVERGTSSRWEGPVEIEMPGDVVALTLERVAPNPFAHVTTLTLAVPRAGDATVRAYDVAGHEAGEIHHGFLPSGRAALRWEGKDPQGRPLAPGVYLVRAVVNGETATTRVIRMP